MGRRTCSHKDVTCAKSVSDIDVLNIDVIFSAPGEDHECFIDCINSAEKRTGRKKQRIIIMAGCYLQLPPPDGNLLRYS
eukprot:Pgem_evm1s316